MPRRKATTAQGLRVWKSIEADAPEWILTADEFIASWRTCPYTTGTGKPNEYNRIPHNTWPAIWELANHVVICMDLGFDGEGGKFSHFVDWELGDLYS